MLLYKCLHVPLFHSQHVFAHEFIEKVKKVKVKVNCFYFGFTFTQMITQIERFTMDVEVQGYLFYFFSNDFNRRMFSVSRCSLFGPPLQTVPGCLDPSRTCNCSRDLILPLDISIVIKTSFVASRPRSISSSPIPTTPSSSIQNENEIKNPPGSTLD